MQTHSVNSAVWLSKNACRSTSQNDIHLESAGLKVSSVMMPKGMTGGFEDFMNMSAGAQLAASFH